MWSGRCLINADETTESLEKRAAEREQLDILGSPNNSVATPIPEPRSIRYTDYDHPFETVDVRDKSVHVYGLSPLSWVTCGDNVYVLELLRMGYIRVEPHGALKILQLQFVLSADCLTESKSHYVARFTPRSGVGASEGSPYRTSRSFLSADDISEVLKGADNYVLNRLFRKTPTAGYVA